MQGQIDHWLIINSSKAEDKDGSGRMVLKVSLNKDSLVFAFSFGLSSGIETVSQLLNKDLQFPISKELAYRQNSIFLSSSVLCKM